MILDVAGHLFANLWVRMPHCEDIQRLPPLGKPWTSADICGARLCPSSHLRARSPSTNQRRPRPLSSAFARKRWRSSRRAGMARKARVKSKHGRTAPRRGEHDQTGRRDETKRGNHCETACWNVGQCWFHGREDALAI